MLKLVLCVFSMIFIQMMPLILIDFVHVKNLFWIIFPFYKHVALFWPVLPHPGLELSSASFLDSLFFKESFVKISEFFSTGWEPIQLVLHDHSRFINTLPWFVQFSLIWAWNWAPFLLLDYLFFEESSIKISEFLSTGWTDWEPVQAVLHDQPCFSMFWSLFLLWIEPLGSEALVGLL